MITIKKNTDYISKELVDAKQNSKDYDDINKKEIRTTLRKEQGNICAYCMSRLDKNEHKTKIEHLLSQSANKTEKLEYKNMVLCCKGGEGLPKKEQFCDSFKGAKEIPQIIKHLHNDISGYIIYGNDGTISSNDKELDAEINDCLNLNNGKYLKENRKQKIADIQSKLQSKFQDKSANANIFKKLINSYESCLEKEPFCGVVIFYLKKSLKGRA
ncbi:MAG: TIGR02646 family protein [Candidatus Delongbacteria bacterium]|nr:TIGR02646 family protein [Candidatus Delongbacteria bacterium]MBN2836175.1 TIGR02646 family protein [Candidatus Delongbacteria bacterium]